MTEASIAGAPVFRREVQDCRPVVLCVGFALPQGDPAWQDFRAVSALSQAQAVARMFEVAPAVVLIDLDLPQGSPIAVADFASYRHPDARVIFVSGGEMFSDGSLFAHCPNVHAHVGRGMSEPDMVALVSHHANSGPSRR